MSLESGNNFYNSVRGVLGLFSNVNKANKGNSSLEGEDTQVTSQFESAMKSEEILSLTNLWIQNDEIYSKDIKRQQKDNIDYWIGKQFNEFQTAGTKRPLVDNLIFEAIETFLPIATRGNPQANVFGDGTEEGNKFAKKIEKALESLANIQKMRMVLKGVTRNWCLYMIGSVKIVWDSSKGEIGLRNILPSKLILDPNAEIGPDGKYYGDYIGEKKRKSVKKLISMFPKSSTVLKAKAQDNLGAKLNYIEWHTRFDVFYTMDNDLVLGKYKNPHWNYDGFSKTKNQITGEIEEQFVEGKNHFEIPEFPYLFLSIFSLGKRPHDETSIVNQNIPLQDVINRRYQQIDSNVDSQNNGIVLSGKHFTKEQAAEAATQLNRGNPLWVPDGDIRASYARDTAPALPSDVFRHLDDARSELRNIFGTSGSTPQGVEGQSSVRGKILINQLDSSRIGGGVTEYIEQLAASIYNWNVQMMCVYYTEDHAFTVTGTKSQESLVLRDTDFVSKITVSVKDGSLIPKDPLTKRNEAIDLWSAGAIAPIPFYSALDYPNPYESAKELLIWMMIQKGALPPQVMFPDLEAPQSSTGEINNGPHVTNEEDDANIKQPVNNAPDITSQQLLSSVKL